LLELRDVTVDYLTPAGTKRAVDNVSFALAPGEVLGLAGESGSGKSTIAQAILRILRPPGLISGGEVLWEGKDILSLDPSALRAFRWTEIAMAFQSALNALNPVMTVGDQIADTLRAHGVKDRREIARRIDELLKVVGIDANRAKAYPHQLSGGMRQRAVIAIALALRPKLLIMDEPTTALDVVVQRSIMEQIRDLKATLGFSILFITHDISLMVEFSDRMAIMYGGKLVEMAPAAELFQNPQHPYTRGLLDSFPSLTAPKTRLSGIPGSPPDLLALPSGCVFHPRCPRRFEPCDTFEPPLDHTGPDHRTACFLYPTAPSEVSV
jgi:peptide/nickel transport system ATP-binding protein